MHEFVIMAKKFQTFLNGNATSLQEGSRVMFSWCHKPEDDIETNLRLFLGC